MDGIDLDHSPFSRPIVSEAGSRRETMHREDASSSRSPNNRLDDCKRRRVCSPDDIGGCEDAITVGDIYALSADSLLLDDMPDLANRRNAASEPVDEKPFGFGKTNVIGMFFMNAM